MPQIGTRQLKIKIGSTEYTAEVTNCEVTSQKADSDFLTYAMAAGSGAREYRLQFTAVQDAATGTLWDKMWTSAGTSVAVSVSPYGSTTFTATNPGFTGNVTITEPDGTLIGGEADESTTARQTFECSWVFDAKPTRVITGTF